MPFTNQTEEKQIERAVLVGLSCPSFNTDQDADERTMDELRALAETAGAEAVAMTLQRRPAPDARTFIGEGKAEEVKQLAEMNDASLILFDNELSPSQMSNLEELTGRTVLDRSALILDIFAQRARTGEGKLQGTIEDDDTVEVSAQEYFSGCTYIPVGSMANALLEVKSGTADIALVDSVCALGMVRPDSDYADLVVNMDNNFGDQFYGIAFRKGSDFTAMVNESIAKLKEDGTVAELAEKYGLTDALIQ